MGNSYTTKEDDNIDETVLYKDRINSIISQQNEVVAAYPNDERLSVYFVSTNSYGLKTLYYYDAVDDKTAEMDLKEVIPMKDVWLTKNRDYIFVGFEERYAVLVRVDTKTNKVKRIVQGRYVRRTEDGFVVVKTRCINEETATCVAEEIYAYTDYYYNESGICTGHGEEHDEPY